MIIIIMIVLQVVSYLGLYLRECMGSHFTSHSHPFPSHAPSCRFRDHGGEPKRPWFLFVLTEKGRELSEDDINAGLVKDFLRDIGSNIRDQDLKNPRRLYENMRLVRSMGDREKGGKMVKVFVPRNVALLFFNDVPHEYFQGARTEVTIYHDNEVMEDLKKTGPIDQQINETLDYILANTREDQSPTFVEYPRKAVREAVVNAFYHRGYEPDHYDPVKVRIYSTHVDIISYPGPHQSLKSSHFLEDSDMPPVKTRNRRIGEFLVKRKLAEEKGTGVRTIFNSMKRNGNFKPEFQFDVTYFRVRLPRHPKFMVRELLTTTNQLVAKGEKQKAVDQLLEFLKKYPDIRDERLFEKLIKLHDDDKSHPKVQQYQQFITDRLERRAALASELHKWCEERPQDIELGVEIVQRLVKEGATSDHDALQKAIGIAVASLLEHNDNRELRLQANQRAHQLFQAMDEVTKTDAYVAFQYACCKFNLYLLNTKGMGGRQRKELSSYLKEAEVCVNDALQLTSEEYTDHKARHYRQLGYIHFFLLGIKISTVSNVIDYYDKARVHNPSIHINLLFIPPGFSTRYQEKTQEHRQKFSKLREKKGET